MKFVKSSFNHNNDDEESFALRDSARSDDVSIEMNPVSTSSEDVARRERELKAREAKMAAMERELEQREKNLNSLGARLPNWPFGKLWSFTYHSIPNEITPENQKFVRYFYRLLLFEWVCLIWNAITSIVGELDGCGSLFGMLFNFIFVVTGCFLSWHGWYAPIYGGGKSNSVSSIRYARFYCFFVVFHLAWVVVQGVGVFYGQGVLTLIPAITGSCNATAVFSFIATTFWGLNFLISSALLKMAYSKYKRGGGNMTSMKSDLTKEAVKASFRSST